MEKVKNSNILSLGLARAKNGFLNFFRNKINRTTTQKYLLGNNEFTPEIICPFGTWSWCLRIYPTANPGADTIILVLNGVRIQLFFDLANNDFEFFEFRLPGQPYIERQDSIQIGNELGIDAEFYLLFDRVMFDNE